jgi:hypothetical protein
MKTTPTDHARELEQAATEECFEFHGCFTGDCPHGSVQECGTHFFRAGAKWDLQSKLVRQLVASLDDAKYFVIERYGPHTPLEQLIEQTLSAYRAAIGGKE